MARLIAIAGQLTRSEAGASMYEYGLLVALLALVAAAGASALGAGLNSFLGTASGSL